MSLYVSGQESGKVTRREAGDAKRGSRGREAGERGTRSGGGQWTFRLAVFFIFLLAASGCAGSSPAVEPASMGRSLQEVTPATTEAAAPPQTTLPAVDNPPSPTPPPTPTQAATATPAPSPTATPTPLPSPTATSAPALSQLTTGGCCVQPYFSFDSSQVRFIDKPGPAAPVGVYGVNLAAPQTGSTLVYETIGFRNEEETMVATLDGDLARLTDERTGQSWAVDTGGNRPHFSPDGRQILWVATDREGPYDRRQSDIWLANLDGSNARRLLSLYGGGFSGWFPDGRRILLVGRDVPSEEEVTLATYELDSGRRTNLFSHKRLRGAEISPDGNWIVFFLTFSDDGAEDGLWLLDDTGSVRQRLEVPGFGAYRWQDDDTLLYIPMRASAADSMQLWAVDLPEAGLRPLTDPATLSFSISNGDWDVSRNGRYVVFVSSADHNIWLITLPE